MFKQLKHFFSKDKIISITSRFTTLKKYLRSKALWQVNCESTARGVAVGFFSALIPVIPLQTIIAVILAILVRANVLIAFASSWISNPLTIVPLTYFTYYLGDWLIGESKGKKIAEQIKWNYDSFPEFWTSFLTWFLQVGKAFFIGLPLVALCAAAIGYLLVKLIWYGVKYFKIYFKA